MAVFGSLISTDSVSSRVTASGGSRVSLSILSTSAANCGSVSWRPETFTLTPRPGRVRRHAAACRPAVFSTQRPRSLISPVSSAIGTKSAGET